MQRIDEQTAKGTDAYELGLSRRDRLGLVVSLIGVFGIGLLAFSGKDVSQSIAGIAQLLIASAVFVLALSYVYGVLLLEGFGNRRGARLTSDVMLFVVPAAVAASVVLSLIRG